ncbi:PREDICTED: islet amyloid polypeptide [Condylura cristata]|uniref:islet amyloid polypeptide n=1 Tax=Condylura cristata TaxID=143302 RepID=UPI0003343B2E|nr:PREDICTED: islet amyloid polypeptide [Condylura cristata]
MCILKLSVLLIVLALALNHLEAMPMESHQMEKRKCNTATCAIQRLANFLIHFSNSFGDASSPTNVGPNTYGKRNTAEVLNREPLTDFPL